jgi:transposase InsO family protein
LAIFFGLQKFDDFLRGIKFKLLTDHKPLQHLFGTKRHLPKLAVSRLTRWALLVGSYDFDIMYRRGTSNIVADYLSRFPDPDVEPTTLEKRLHYISDDQRELAQEDLCLNPTTLRNTTNTDHILKTVKIRLSAGWSNGSVTDELKPYYDKRYELTVEDGILMWNGRIIVPSKLRTTVLKHLHRGHPGTVASKALARYYVWWPRMDTDIENTVKECYECQSERPNQPELPVFSWHIPDEVWERVHVDLAGPFEGRHWLVLVDALSKWVEVRHLQTTTATAVCDALQNIFCTFGIPRIIVSDNGPQFTAGDFERFCKQHCIHHITSAPYHPRTNGLAERFIRTFKTRMRASHTGTVTSRLQQVLFSYRNTPHTTLGKSPAEAMFGRRLRDVLDNCKPDRRQNVQYKNIKRHIETPVTRTFSPGQQVFYKTSTDNQWKQGTVHRRTHYYSYVVTTPDGRQRRLHADHMRERVTSAATDLPLASPTSTANAQVDTGSTNATGVDTTDNPQSPVPHHDIIRQSSGQQQSTSTPTPQQVDPTQSTPVMPRRSTRVRRPPLRFSPPPTHS